MRRRDEGVYDFTQIMHEYSKYVLPETRERPLVTIINLCLENLNFSFYDCYPSITSQIQNLLSVESSYETIFDPDPVANLDHVYLLSLKSPFYLTDTVVKYSVTDTGRAVACVDLPHHGLRHN